MNLEEEGAFFYKHQHLWIVFVTGGDSIWGHGHCWPWQCWGQLDSVGCEGFPNPNNSMILSCFAGLGSCWGVTCAVVALCAGVCQFAAPATSVPTSGPCWCPGVPIVLVFLVFQSSHGLEKGQGDNCSSVCCPDTWRIGFGVGRLCLLSAPCSLILENAHNPSQGTGVSLL